MKPIMSFLMMLMMVVTVSITAQDAAAWCNPGILVCGDVIDSTTTNGHDDISRYRYCGIDTERFYGNAHVYKIMHPGGDLWVTLEWEGDAAADSALHLVLLDDCNANHCLGQDPHYMEGNFDEGDIWIIVDGRTNAADGTAYVLKVFCGDNPLAVELLSFSGAAVDQGIALNWSTASETNNDYFNIERRVAGSSDWTMIATIPGQGTSASSHYYNYLDNTVAYGTYDYRLSAVSMDGAVEDLGTAVITAAPAVEATVEDFKLAGNFPNPFNPSTTIKFQVGEPTTIILDVFDVAGRLIRTLASGQHANGSYEVPFNGSDLASGVYFARLSSPSRSEMMKMVLMK